MDCKEIVRVHLQCVGCSHANYSGTKLIKPDQK